MIEINKGRLKILSWCDYPESSAIDQAVNLANHPRAVEHVVLLPDCHAGIGMPIGGVVGLKDAVSPGCVGSDVCCGMLAAKSNIKADAIDKRGYGEIINLIRSEIPMGFNRQKDSSKYHREAKKIVSDSYETVDPKFIMEVAAQLCTLGGG